MIFVSPHCSRSSLVIKFVLSVFRILSPKSQSFVCGIFSDFFDGSFFFSLVKIKTVLLEFVVDYFLKHTQKPLVWYILLSDYTTGTRVLNCGMDKCVCFNDSTIIMHVRTIIIRGDDNNHRERYHSSSEKVDSHYEMAKATNVFFVLERIRRLFCRRVFLVLGFVLVSVTNQS